MIGSLGEAEVFSFHATKFLNTLEGGAVVTNNDQFAARMRLMKNFGFTYYDQTEYIGTNGKMNEVSAAVGLTNLESMDDFIAHNRRNYRDYAERLAAVPGVSLVAYNDAEKCNYQYVVLEIDQEHAGISRDHLLEILHSENVLARRYFYPGCHRMQPYRAFSPHAGLLLPETEKLTTRVLCLPTGTAVSEERISIIYQIISLVVENGAEICRRMTADKGSMAPFKTTSVAQLAPQELTEV